MSPLPLAITVQPGSDACVPPCPGTSTLPLCSLLFMVLDPAFRPCASALLLANLNWFQGRLHNSGGLVLRARPAGLAVLLSRALV